MTCAVPRLVLIYGAQMEISVEMTKLSRKTQFHVALFITLFFDNFSLKPIAWVSYGISLHRTVTSSNLTTANNLIWNLLALSFQMVYVCKIPPRGGGRVSRVEPRYNELLYNEVRGITNDILSS